MTDFTGLIDLASERFGGMVQYATDDFFAPKENLLRDAEPVWIEGKYTDQGKWMDGWESRRKRVPGHDWCILRLGLSGVIRGVVVDTAFFTGNFPESCSIEAACIPGAPSPANLLSPDVAWVEILPRSTLRGNAKNPFAIERSERTTHLRLHIYPDGGVARLRVYGDCVPDWPRLLRGGEVNLAAAENGGRALGANDAHYGRPLNLIMPGRGVNMGDGWETRRRRGPGHDWAVLELAAPGVISTVEVDTNHFKGNYPDTCAIDVIHAPGATWESLNADDTPWVELLGRTKLQAHTRHFFQAELAAAGEVTHARLRIYPDGGVSRLRLLGRVSAEVGERLMIARINALGGVELGALLKQCCGAPRWVEGMLARRPFADGAALLRAAEEVWWGLERADWLEAFATHPRIGERKSHAQSAEANRWSAQEQRGVQSVHDEVRAALAEANAAYEARFGYTYIVCATGRTADELLALARLRLGNDPDDEVRHAAAEQEQITALRLRRLFAV